MASSLKLFARPHPALGSAAVTSLPSSATTLILLSGQQRLKSTRLSWGRRYKNPDAWLHRPRPLRVYDPLPLDREGSLGSALWARRENHQISTLRRVGCRLWCRGLRRGPVHLLSLTRFWYKCKDGEQSQERGLSCFSLPKERVSQGPAQWESAWQHEQSPDSSPLVVLRHWAKAIMLCTSFLLP